MIDWLAQIWQWYQLPLAGGVAVAMLCSVLSPFIVLKRMSFIGEGIAHAAFGGVGAALLAGVFFAGVRPMLARDGIVAAFCLATALLIGWTARRGRVSEDTSIGIWLVTGMALGVALLDLRVQVVEAMERAGHSVRDSLGYTPGFEEILFGDVLLVTPAEVVISWIIAGVVVLLVVLLFKELVFFAFDEETALAFGVPTSMIYYGLLVCTALAVVAAMRSVGVILATALLVLPGASAKLWSHRIGVVTLLSAMFGIGGVVAGLLLAVWLGNFAPGPVIVLTLAAAFAVSYVVTARRRRRNRLA